MRSFTVLIIPCLTKEAVGFTLLLFFLLVLLKLVNAFSARDQQTNGATSCVGLHATLMILTRAGLSLQSSTNRAPSPSSTPHPLMLFLLLLLLLLLLFPTLQCRIWNLESFPSLHSLIKNQRQLIHRRPCSFHTTGADCCVCACLCMCMQACMCLPTPF